MKTFSYVIDHDTGYAPNPQDGICTLVQCKFQGYSPKRNIVEMADESDVILGTGGSSTRSTGHKTLIYVMKVTAKIPFNTYLTSDRYKYRVDCCDEGKGNEYALISSEFVYFGGDAINTGTLPPKYQCIEKRGPRYRYLKPDSIGNDLLELLIRLYGKGMKGDPKVRAV